MRLTSHKRGYDGAWKRVSVEFRRRNPYCAGCLAMGKSVPATLVDHIVPHRGNYHLFWSRRNWQSCCEWHHNVIKPQLERLFEWGQIPQSDLMLYSAKAVALSREKYKLAVGLDGFQIAGS